MMRADDALLGALRALVSALDALGKPAMIIGGIAVIARGVPRQTIDIDATVAAADLDLDEVLATLAARHITPRIENAWPSPASVRCCCSATTPRARLSR